MSENIYDEDTDPDVTDDEFDIDLDTFLFIDENEVRYFQRYFLEISDEVVPVEQTFVVILEDNFDIQRLDDENLYVWYFITTVDQREE